MPQTQLCTRSGHLMLCFVLLLGLLSSLQVSRGPKAAMQAKVFTSPDEFPHANRAVAATAAKVCVLAFRNLALSLYTSFMPCGHAHVQ